MVIDTRIELPVHRVDQRGHQLTRRIQVGHAPERRLEQLEAEFVLRRLTAHVLLDEIKDQFVEVVAVDEPNNAVQIAERKAGENDDDLVDQVT